jgi:hypothetical protein
VQAARSKASISASSGARTRAKIGAKTGAAGGAQGREGGTARHNAGTGSRALGNKRMWVIYLNAAIAVAIVAAFVVWTMRGRK